MQADLLGTAGATAQVALTALTALHHAVGPWLMTADELPTGCKGLRLQTRSTG